jgi:hypothetical protein
MIPYELRYVTARSYEVVYKDEVIGHVAQTWNGCWHGVVGKARSEIAYEHRGSAAEWVYQIHRGYAQCQTS